MGAKSSPEAHGCVYPSMRDDPDYQEFGINQYRRHFYDHVFNEETGKSGITRINIEYLAMKTKQPIGYLKNILIFPNNLYQFDSVKNIIWCKKWFWYSIKMPGNPQSYLRAIINEYNATIDCNEFWRGFFETNQEVLNRFYLRHCDKLFKKAAKNPDFAFTKSKILRMEVMEELYLIKKRLFNETNEQGITFTVDSLNKI